MDHEQHGRITEPAGARTAARSSRLRCDFRASNDCRIRACGYTIPAGLKTPGTWLSKPSHRDAVLLALTLVPFAAIAFLWFIGVFRNRLTDHEDQVFASVFLASGLLFVASPFGAAAVTDALVESARLRILPATPITAAVA